MIKKTYVRVITLLLVALMILGVMAPAFTSYAATVAVVTSNSNNVIVNGVPSSPLTEGKYYFKVENVDSSSFSLKYGESESSISESADGAKLEADGKISFAGLTFTNNNSSGDKKWKNNDVFWIELTSSNADGEMILAYSYSTSYSQSLGEAGNRDRSRSNVSRIKKGTRINLLSTVVSTDFEYVEGKDYRAFVTFKQGDFKRYSDVGSGSPKMDYIEATSYDGKLAFKIDLLDLAYTGSGDTVEYEFVYYENNEKFTQNVSVKVDNCIPYVDKDDPGEDDEDVNLDPLIPHIIVSQYDYGTTQVSAGQVIDLNLSFENTSTQYDLDNIVMKITTPDGFSITSSSNTYHFDHLDVGESISKTISMQANPNAEAQSYAINIEFSFQYIANDTRKSGESSESISIPVTQPDRFSVDEIQVPTSLYVGDEYNLSINFVNKGKTQVYNVTAELRGNMQNSGERSFIGNVASGAEESADFYVTPTEAGKMEGEVVISYEDASMNVREVTRPFTIMVEEMPYVDPGIDFPVVDPQPIEEPSLFTVQNVVLFVVAAGVAGATGYMTVLKIKAKRSEFDDEDL